MSTFESSSEQERASPAEAATGVSSEEQIKKILEENLRLTQEIHAMVMSIRRHLFWQKVMSAIYIIILVAPIIVALIYLPPLLKPYLDQYSQLLGDVPSGQSGGTIDIQKFLDQRQ